MIYAQYNIIIYFAATIVNLLQFVFSFPNGNEYMKDVANSVDAPGVFFDKMFIQKNNIMDNSPSNKRMKRQVGSGAGKYVDTAKMPQVKVLRLFLQLFKNLWADSHIGGSTPFHPDVCKPVLYLFKDKVIEFFFPDPRVEHKKKSH
ncbi:hypothetical protein O3G_MSEX013190 [Manduca sexta]|uniref:Uncharacterized protein n=1 Tax=Manduca sexta TaxID=7130 RepID=A0A921ZRZ8_MANSE|nr:hypothetical protein O3G_MSEX013190 [Manduca sexta]